MPLRQTQIQVTQYLNDKLISFNDQPATAGQTGTASVGILFSDSGILSNRSVDNLNVAFHRPRCWYLNLCHRILCRQLQQFLRIQAS